MSRILTGICEADPAGGYTKWPSVGETLFCLQRTFPCTGLFQNAITHPDEDRLLAELLTFITSADTSILWHMEQKLMHAPRHGHHVHMAARDIYQRQASTPNVVRLSNLCTPGFRPQNGCRNK